MFPSVIAIRTRLYATSIRGHGEYGEERRHLGKNPERIAHYEVEAKERPGVALSANAEGAQFWLGGSGHPVEPHLPVRHKCLAGVTYLRGNLSEIRFVATTLMRRHIGNLDTKSVLFRELCSIAGKVFLGQRDAIPRSDSPTNECPYCPRERSRSGVTPPSNKPDHKQGVLPR